MPLLTKNQLLNAAIADDTKNIVAHLTAAIKRANDVVARMLSLNDDDLTSWLNSQPPAETTALFSTHGNLGELLNGAHHIALALLVANGMDAPSAMVDVRSVAEKLGDRGRVLAFDATTGVFSVTTPQPEPEPEV